MAIRDIRLDGDQILRKKCKQVEVFDKKLAELIDDMAETMYKAGGVGLAAPQVGILKRVVVIDVGDGLIELINPVITQTFKKQTGYEGCLSCPDILGVVERPKEVTVKAFDRNKNEVELKGTDLLARAICHELDHLDGILFKDKAETIKQREEKQNN